MSEPTPQETKAEPRKVLLHGWYAIIPTVIGFDLESEGDVVILPHPDLAALRASVAEQDVWIARAKVLLVAITDVRQSLSIDEARALLGEGGQ